MAPIKSYLLSSFVRSHGHLDEDAFRRAEPHPWLIWEAGPWKPGGSRTLVSFTPPTPVPSPLSKGAEVLAFGFNVKEGVPEPQVSLGRGEGCDIVINDGTISNHHLVFIRSSQGWLVQDVGSRNGSTVQGVTLVPGQPQLLKSTARLTAGSVDFSFYEPKDMLWRLTQHR